MLIVGASLKIIKMDYLHLPILIKIDDGFLGKYPTVQKVLESNEEAGR